MKVPYNQEVEGIRKRSTTETHNRRYQFEDKCAHSSSSHYCSSHVVDDSGVSRVFCTANINMMCVVSVCIDQTGPWKSEHLTSISLQGMMLEGRSTLYLALPETPSFYKASTHPYPTASCALPLMKGA